MMTTEPEMTSFTLELVTAGDNCAVLQITGEVDVSTAPQVRDQVVRLIADGVVRLIADLRDVTFLDSAGLGALVGSLRRVRVHDGSLTIATSTSRLLRLFELTGLASAFTVYPTVWEAVDADEGWLAAIGGEGFGTALEWCSKHGLA
jgi:anti-sigma B factor antagonist